MEKSPKYTPPTVENKIITTPQTEGPEVNKIEKQDNSIFRQIQEPMTRRKFLEIATKVAIGLTTGYVVNNEIDGLTAKYQKEKMGGIEIEYSEELTKLYEEVHKMPEKKKEYTDLQVGKNLAERIFEYPKKIRDSNKQNFDEFAKGLSQEEFDDLIVGRWHAGPGGSTDEKSAYILEELIRNNKKISADCLEYLTYTDPADKEAIEKFNRGEISAKEMAWYAGSENEPRLEFAKKYSIEIIGLEKDKAEVVLNRPDWYGRYKEISERIEDITREKKKDGIIVIDIGQEHTTTDVWKYFNVIERLRSKGKAIRPTEETASENNYTIKEYLEKSGFKPIVLQMEDWEKRTYIHDNILANWYEDLPGKDKESYYKFSENSWQNYSLEKNNEGVYQYPNGKENTFSVVINIPGKVPKKPPILNGYKSAYDNPYLAEILRKTDGIGDVEISQNLILKVKDLPIVEVNKNTGETVKMYLPKQAKKQII